MAIYDVNGNSLANAYDVNGNALINAYDVNGTEIWSASPPSLKVATYNVGDWGWGDGLPTAEYKESYITLQNTIFSNIDADICAIQEWSTYICTDGTPSSDVTSLYFQYLYASGVWAIGSNIPLRDFQAIDYSTVTVTGDYAKYEKAYFYIGGKKVCILNVHFCYENKTNQGLQCAEILNVAEQEDYVIICGDFNTNIHALTDSDYIDFIKPFIDAGYTDANCGAFGILPTYYSTSDPQGTYTPATDHIIVSSNITITNAYADTTKLTDGLDQKIDHIPLVAELLIT